jgi:ferredoxin
MKNFVTVLLGLIASSAFGIWIGFSILSFGEGERRAARIALFLALCSVLLLLGAILLPPQILNIILGIGMAIGVIAILVFFLPIGRMEWGQDERANRFDERDIVFARTRLRPDSPEFIAYYEMRPENREIDDQFRKLPGLLSKDALFADPLVFAKAGASFGLTEAMREEVDGPVAGVVEEFSVEHASSMLKEAALTFGALDVGICSLNPCHVYSHVGRGAGPYGSPITLEHRNAIAFTVEMDHKIMRNAPKAPVVLESAQRYVQAAVIAIQLGNLIRSLGYPARAHIDGNYRVIAPLVARDAGLGEIGRMGILMTPKHGPRVRLGVVTTDMPLFPDGRQYDTTVLDFCRICLKCVENCPSRAIPHGDRIEIEGGLRWRLDANRCYRYWRVTGADCGICMAVCPYSHPDNWGHGIIRWAVQRSGAARRAALWLDDRFYGRTPFRRVGQTR